jgi:SAM-dependent methyltransferase
MGNVIDWDQQNGDGALLEGVPDGSLDFVHSSHSLEHMDDPAVAMTNWLRVLKPGGHLLLTLPDEDMFEQGVWPSRYAGADHKMSWTIYKDQSWCPVSRNVIDFLTAHGWGALIEILKIEKLDNTFNYNDPAWDQTRGPIQECAIEIILRKRTNDEIVRKGRLPPEQFLTIKTGP